jgi:hypothetical protein
VFACGRIFRILLHEEKLADGRSDACFLRH